MRKLKFDLQVDPTALLAANPEAFYSAAYLTSDVPNNFRTLPGVKYQTKLGTVVFGNVLQSSTCAWPTPGSTDDLSAVLIDVCAVSAMAQICQFDLEQSFVSLQMTKGSNSDFSVASFMNFYWETMAKTVAQDIESIRWQGDTTSGNGLLNKFDGLMKLIDAGSPVDANVNGFTGVGVITGLTAANVITAVKAVKNAIPAALKGRTDTVIFCGYDTYDLYVDAGVAANLFHYDFNDKSNYGGLTVPGTGIRLEAVHGLDGTGDMYAFRLAIAAIGVDAEGEEQNYKLWYSEDNNEGRFRAAFKMGVNVAFTAECVKFKSTI